MPFVIENTTAEHVVAAVDAVLLRAQGANAQYVADFCLISLPMANRALAMCTELGFAVSNAGMHLSNGPFSRYLVSAVERQRAAVFRVVVEQYEPFRLFRDRLALGEHPAQAADRVKAVY